MQVFCDFDGTVSKEDVTDLVLQRYARPEWRAIEDQWVSGKITSAICMQRQIRLIEATRAELNAFLDTVEIDSDFIAFKRFCDNAGLGLSVVSDGVDYFIRRVLRRHQITSIPVIANRLREGDELSKSAYDLDFPAISSSCNAGSGVCKCAVVSPSVDYIYIGDGRSDFCVSNEAPVVFAKSNLADYCRSRGIEFFPYDSFADVQRSLASILSIPSRRRPALPVKKSA
jgi:2-hydroxy-3-keto-5-methylthiopentenyl-1-phosphate phosphatase